MTSEYLSGKLKGLVKRIVLGETLPNFPYTLKEDESYQHSIYKAIPSIKRDESAALVLASRYKQDAALARNAVHRLRTNRHPNVLKLQDTVEVDGCVYMAVEECTPLKLYVSKTNLTVDDVLCGVYSILKALMFLHDECHFIHGQLCIDAIYVDTSGTWKLGGFEYLGDHYESVYQHASQQFPELKSMPSLSPHLQYTLDAYLLGTMIESIVHDYLNETIPKIDHLTAALKHRDPSRRPRIKDILHLGTSAQPTSHPPSYEGLFRIDLIGISEFLETFHIQETDDQAKEIRKLCESIQKRKLSPQFELRRVLPFLIQCIGIYLNGSLTVSPTPTSLTPSASPFQLLLCSQENGLASLLLHSFFVCTVYLPTLADTPAISTSSSSPSTSSSSSSSSALSHIASSASNYYMSLMRHSTSEEQLSQKSLSSSPQEDNSGYAERLMMPLIERIFASSDTVCRLTALRCLPSFISKILAKTFNEKFFKYVLASFSSNHLHIKSAAITSVADIAEKLNEKNMHETLRALARTQIDPQPDIRHNTVISLAKIGKHLNAALRSSVLIPALTRSLADPSLPARTAALQSLAATQLLYTDEQIVNVILPALCKLLLDAPMKAMVLQVLYTLLRRIEQETGVAMATENEGNLAALSLSPPKSTTTNELSAMHLSNTAVMIQPSEKIEQEEIVDRDALRSKKAEQRDQGWEYVLDVDPMLDEELKGTTLSNHHHSHNRVKSFSSYGHHAEEEKKQKASDDEDDDERDNVAVSSYSQPSRHTKSGMTLQRRTK